MQSVKHSILLPNETIMALADSKDPTDIKIDTLHAIDLDDVLPHIAEQIKTNPWY